MHLLSQTNSQKENQLIEFNQLLGDIPEEKSFYSPSDANYQPNQCYQDIPLNVTIIEKLLRLQSQHIKSKSNVKWSHGVPCISNNPLVGALLRCKHAV